MLEPVVVMRSSTNVIKSDSRSTAASWDPSELENLAPIHDPMLDETAVHTNIKTRASSPVYAAREQAEDILADAQKKAQAILQEARDKGYQEGREAIEQELIDAAAAIRTLAEETRQWQAELVSSAEPQIVAMVISITKKLFGNGFQLEEKDLKPFLSQVLQRAKSLGELRCFLHPGDIAILNKEWEQEQQVFHGIGMTLVPDENIQRGGCTVEGLYGSVDALLETRLDALIETLKDTSSSEEVEPS